MPIPDCWQKELHKPLWSIWFSEGLWEIKTCHRWVQCSDILPGLDFLPTLFHPWWMSHPKQPPSSNWTANQSSDGRDACGGGGVWRVGLPGNFIHVISRRKIPSLEGKGMHWSPPFHKQNSSPFIYVILSISMKFGGPTSFHSYIHQIEAKILQCYAMIGGPWRKYHIVTKNKSYWAQIWVNHLLGMASCHFPSVMGPTCWVCCKN